MTGVARRAYFLLALSLGRLLRSGRYSRTLIDPEDGVLVRKRRLIHAPLLVWLGGGLLRILDTGVRVLPQRDWEAREGRLYRDIYGAAVRVEPGGTLLLPRFAGETLATLLENPAIDEPSRREAIRLAVVALADLHRGGFTHGDAMAENVMIDLQGRSAHWFDFETMHEPGRPLAWRRADDVRALLATSLLRTPPDRFAETLDLIVDRYADGEVTRHVAARFTSVLQRALTLHLGQAPLSFRSFGEIARLLRERSHPRGSHP